MKTRDRILLCTLELFNEHGESNVTTLEIANELEISPGNLYYHFKGKEALLDALVDDFVLSTRSLLLSDDNPDDVEPEDLWLLLHLLFEAIATHRFLFQDLSNLMSRYPALRQQMQPWITALRQRLEQVLQALHASVCATLKAALFLRFVDPGAGGGEVGLCQAQVAVGY